MVLTDHPLGRLPGLHACPLQGTGACAGPLAELDFWSEGAANLNAIHEQLSSDRIQKVVKILQLADSTYFQAIQRLLQVCCGSLHGSHCKTQLATTTM